MNNYDEIAREAVRKVAGLGMVPNRELLHKVSMDFTYQCAYEAAKLQAERFNKDLDDSYIESLSKEELN